MSKSIEPVRQPAPPVGRIIDIELLALDLDTCTRCVGTATNIGRAIEAVSRVLEVTGTTVRSEKRVIATDEDARRYRFVSSPTVRVDGRDIVVDTLESKCDSCTDLCGCSEGTNCRMWLYQGAEHAEAPVGLIVEALLREIVGSAAGAAKADAMGDFEVPTNLREFFARQAAKRTAAAKPCCGPAEQESCCDATEKPTCCSGPEPAACGCR